MYIDGPQGPALGIAEGLHQLGMRLTAPDKITTNAGNILCLQHGSPAMLATYLMRAYEDRVDRENTAYLSTKAGSGDFLEAGEIHRWDWSMLRQQLRRRRGNNHEKSLLMQLMCGTLPTRKWLAEHGFAIEPCCECGATDDLAHRLAPCGLRPLPHLDGQGLRAHEVKAALLRPMPPARNPQDPAVRAFVCMPGGTTKQVCLKEFSWDPSVPVYTDGSVIFPDIPELACGASAAYQLLPSGEQRWIEIQLPADGPQTAVLTEHIAFAEASKLAKHGAIVVVVDCQAVITTWHWNRSRQISHKHKHAMCWLEFEQGSVQQVHKIKSHQGPMAPRQPSGRSTGGSGSIGSL